MRKFKYFLFFLLGIGVSTYQYSNYLEAKTKREIVKSEMITKIKQDIKDHVYVLKPKDKNKLQDCSDESYNYHGGHLTYHPFMKMFDGKFDPLNGFVNSNNWPVYVFTEGLNRFDEDTVMLVGLRGNTAGPHRSRVTKELHNIFKNYENTLVYMPSSYYAAKGKIEDDDAILQSVCHRKMYGSTYIGSAWPGMVNGGSWRVYNKLFKDKAKIFLFSYSNGQIVREDFLDTKKNKDYSPNYISISNYMDFLNEYDAKTEFKHNNNIELVDGIVDVETNYSYGQPLWDLAKFIKERIDGDPTKLYYAAAGIESVVAMNHVRLIQAFNLIGTELPTGVVRYTNNSRNIVIDILTYNKADPYSYGGVNLNTQTVFLKDNRVRNRLSLGHYLIVPYAIKQFSILAEERGILIK